MSRKGNCWDNAVAESFFSSLKKERIKRKSSPWPVVILAAEAEGSEGLRRDGGSRASGSVTAPGVASAASAAVSRYVWGSTPTSFADSHSV